MKEKKRPAQRLLVRVRDLSLGRIARGGGGGVASVVGGGLTASAAREQLRGANDPNRICVSGHRKKAARLRWLLGRNTSAV